MSNIPKGYKQTEAGVIPEDWKVASLGSLTVLMTNGFVGPVTRHYADTGNGVLYVQGYNVEENSFNFHGIKYVTQEFHKAHAKSCLRGSDLLTVQTGDVGLTTVVPDDLAGSNCHALIISRYDKKNVSPGFISYYLNSSPGRSRLRLIETGTTMKHLNVGDMLEFLVPLPPTKAEQTAIAAALSDADALIQSLEKLIAKKRNIKQGAMQELLKPKEGWVVKKLGEIGIFSKGQGIRKDECMSGAIPCIRYGELYTRHNDYIKQYYSFISDSVAQTAKRLKKGDILFAGSGETKEEIGKCAAFLDNTVVYAGGDIVIFSPVNVDSLFLGFYLNTPLVVKQKVSRGQGDAVVHISAGNLKDIEIPIPPLDEQTRIATILSDMDAEIAALETKLAKYRQIKQGMMQELLTGRIRLVRGKTP